MPLSREKLANLRLFRQEIQSPRGDGTTSNTPLLFVIEPTTKCNFSCVHCSRTLSKQTPTDIDLELFCNTLPSLRAALEVYLFGDGEVLLDVPRHLAMISSIYQQDPTCALGFSTNGKLLTPEVYELYATAGIRYIQVSVDAATKELYEDLRRGGSFDELLRNLEEIVRLRRRPNLRWPQMHLATVISRQNYRQLPLLAQFAKEYGFSYWYINAEYPHNPCRALLQLTAADISELERIRADILRDYASYYFAVFDPSIGLRPEMHEPWLESKSAVFCTVPWQRLELKANGDIKICPYYHEPVCTMDGKSVQEVWNGPEFTRIRKAFTTRTGVPSYCSNCRSGMRQQYLAGYPGIPEIPPVNPLTQIIGGIRAAISRRVRG